MRIFNRSTRWVAFFIVTFMMFSCGKSYDEKQRLSREQQQELRRADSLALKIAVLPTMDCLPLYLGCEDSAFQHAGVDVHLYRRNAQIDGDTLLARGHVEGIVTDLVRAQRLRKEGIALNYVTSTNAYWQLIANRLARVKTVGQLSDKMIAMTRFSATDFLSDLAISSARPKPKNDVFRVQVNDVSIRLRMLLNNEMDAAFFTEPQATTARMWKNPVLMDSRDKDLRLGVIAFREDALKDKRRQKQLKAFMKVYNQMCDSINKNGVQHYRVIIAKYMGADGKTIQAIPPLKYTHVSPPRHKDVAGVK